MIEAAHYLGVDPEWVLERPVWLAWALELKACHAGHERYLRRQAQKR